ncbi:uncharacterized protein EI90DRAFT_1299383 [Cantharellus anzutake]|uniref:uncharacterized protein n=1 Tax=Cantharellus anzutake TaxID=1750568 RepID=UPI001903BFE7|nr:uncharacterized protein EI90DRAFT_1299383 [Cantharellus anzutake]KAF8342042.1 hypothetical protein EI90DRAFT_1299383 [Cantharellus anzutake]
MAAHLFALADRRFQEHYSFWFVVFDIMQRLYSCIYDKSKVGQTGRARRVAGSVVSGGVHQCSYLQRSTHRTKSTSNAREGREATVNAMRKWIDQTDTTRRRYYEIRRALGNRCRPGVRYFTKTGLTEETEKGPGGGAFSCV